MIDSEFVGDPLAFVDLETTGANFSNDRIIEVGVVLLDQHGITEWSSLVNPGQALSSFITGLTGITDEMLESAPSFAELAPIIIEMLKGRVFIAHNARFDYTLRILVKLATNNASKLAGDNASTCPLQKELQAES